MIPPTQQPYTPAPVSPPQYAAHTEPPPRRWLKVFIVIVIAIAGIGLTVFVFMRVRSGSGSSGIEDAGAKAREQYIQSVFDQYKDDMDQDGLSDSEEETQGLNKFDFDSDGDGLSDIAELQTWKTDPLHSDSDGDGSNDGIEVLDGSDPTDPGSHGLQEAPTEE